jgi:cytochrome c biogenesis protein CcdA
MSVLFTYALYAIISLSLTVWVAQTLHKNGKIFLVDAFHGNKEMADAVNHLLQVGFYLVNVGFVALFLRFGDTPTDAVTSVEYISTKIGIVLLALGGMHFFNMFNFANMRSKAKRSEARQLELAVDTKPFEVQLDAR